MACVVTLMASSGMSSKTDRIRYRSWSNSSSPGRKSVKGRLVLNLDKFRSFFGKTTNQHQKKVLELSKILKIVLQKLSCMYNIQYRKEDAAQ